MKEIYGLETALILDALYMDNKELSMEELQKRINFLENMEAKDE